MHTHRHPHKHRCTSTRIHSCSCGHTGTQLFGVTSSPKQGTTLTTHWGTALELRGLGSPAPYSPPKAQVLTPLLPRLVVSGLAQVSGLWPPGSGLQAASENLWLEKVLASPIPASPPSTLPGLSRYWVLLLLLLPLPLLPPPPPGPLSLAKAIHLSSPLPAC